MPRSSRAVAGARRTARWRRRRARCARTRSPGGRGDRGHQRAGRRHREDADGISSRSTRWADGGPAAPRTARPTRPHRPCCHCAHLSSRMCGTLRPVTHDHDRRHRALVEEACRKSAMFWLRPAGDGQRRDGVARLASTAPSYVVSGGLEQPLPAMPDGEPVDGDRAQQGHRRPPGGLGRRRPPGWSRARRSGTAPCPSCTRSGSTPPTARQQPERWARESTVTRLAADRRAASSRPAGCRTARTPPSRREPGHDPRAVAVRGRPPSAPPPVA